MAQRRVGERLAALERRLKAAHGLDPRGAAMIALERYEAHGEKAADMPPAAEIAGDVELLGLYYAYLDALWRTEPARQFGDPAGLPFAGDDP